MIGFIFKSIFWVGLVWIAIGKPFHLNTQNITAHTNILKENANTQLEQAKSTAQTIVKVCELTQFHPACQHSKQIETAANNLPSFNTSELNTPSLIAIPKPRITPVQNSVLGMNIPQTPLPPLRPHYSRTVPIQL